MERLKLLTGFCCFPFPPIKAFFPPSRNFHIDFELACLVSRLLPDTEVVTRVTFVQFLLLLKSCWPIFFSFLISAYSY